MRFFYILIIIVNVLLTACSESSSPNGTMDTSPPEFGGVTNVVANGISGIVVQWNAASDDLSASENITYKVFVRRVRDEPFDPELIFNSPDKVVIVEGGALQQHIDELNSSTLYEVGVRAQDESENQDANLEIFEQSTNDLVNFDSMVQPILTQNCATVGCHSTLEATSPAAGLNLETGQSLTGLFQETACDNTIIVGNRLDSYLLKKLTNDPLICGVAMPKDKPPLGSADIQIIKDWLIDIAG